MKSLFEKLPTDIQEKMLDNQIQQGNHKDHNVFIRNIFATKNGGGFDWGASIEGAMYWHTVIENAEKEYLNIIPLDVLNYPINGDILCYVGDNIESILNRERKCVCFMRKNDRILSWGFAESIEDAKVMTHTATWNYAIPVDIFDEYLETVGNSLLLESL